MSEKEYQAAYYKMHRDKKLAYQKVYVAKHPVELAAYQRKYRAAHAIDRAAYAKEYDKIYYQKNKSRWAAKTRSRQVAKLNATPIWLTIEQKGLMQDFYEVARLLSLCVDHIVPLRGNSVRGLHVPWNLQLLTRSENSSKGNRFDSRLAA